jgi:hypothetical protein
MDHRRSERTFELERVTAIAATHTAHRSLAVLARDRTALP